MPRLPGAASPGRAGPGCLTCRHALRSATLLLSVPGGAEAVLHRLGVPLEWLLGTKASFSQLAGAWACDSGTWWDTVP